MAVGSAISRVPGEIPPDIPLLGDPARLDSARRRFYHIDGKRELHSPAL